MTALGNALNRQHGHAVPAKGSGLSAAPRIVIAGKPGDQLRQPVLHRAQSVVDGRQARHNGVGWKRGLVVCGQAAASQNGTQVSWAPTQSRRQRFERAGATAALSGVVLQLSHDRLGHLRPLGQLTLTPAEFTQPAIDRLRDRRPILRHVFLRAPPLIAEINAGRVAG